MNFRMIAVVAAVLTLGSVMVPAADDLAAVLAKMDDSSTKFKSAQADITSDNVQLQPIPDTDTQKGTIIFQRTGGELKMALHLKTDNGKPVPKDVVYAGGVLKFYEPLQKQLQVFKAGSKRDQADTILTLGFGGSGKDLLKAWDVTYAGSEQVNGKQTAKLQLVPKDAQMKNTFPKVILWVDSATGTTVKQQFFDGSGNYRLATYDNLKLNGSVAGNAFDLKTASGTQVVNH